MPKQTGKSKLSDRLGAAGRKAHETHKADDTTLSGGGDLPAGIEGGIAKLTSVKFGEFAKGDFTGEPFFMAAGIVVEPKEHAGIPIEGLRTQIGPEPLCDTPKRSRATLDEHLAWVYNQFRLLGVDTESLDFDSLEETAEALEGAGVYFRFRTWVGDATPQWPNPRTNHDWRGACDYDGGDDQQDDVDDETGGDEEPPFDAPDPGGPGDDLDDVLRDLLVAADGGDTEAQQTLSQRALDAGCLETMVEGAEDWTAVAQMTRDAEQAPKMPSASEKSLFQLGGAADDGDEDAQNAITAAGEDAGVEDEYETWTEWAKAIEAAGSDGGDKESAGRADDWEPAKEEVYFFKLPRARKTIEVKITDVFFDKQTCNLKSLDDGKIFKAVPWTKLTDK